MDIQYYGANCVRITTKKSNILIDPQSDITSINPGTQKIDTILTTQKQFISSNNDNSIFIVDGPGEYEFEDYSIVGVAAQPHTGSTGDKSATIYRITSQEVSILILGHVDSKLSEQQLETLGMVDIVIIPVGGGGYTLDAVDAAAVVRVIEPKIVIPVHTNDDGLSYELPQDNVELFIKELGAQVSEELVEKLKVKSLPEQITIQRLTRQ